MEEDNEATTPPKWEDNFRKSIEAKRDQLGMSQTAMAKALRGRGLQFRQQMVQRVESGERPLRLNEALAFAEILGLDFNAAINGPGTEDSDSALRPQFEQKMRETFKAMVSLHELRDLVIATGDDLMELTDEYVELPITDDSPPIQKATMKLFGIVAQFVGSTGELMDKVVEPLVELDKEYRGEHSQDS
ncbi:helix-turn-helix domain-containing protein [Brevibacterium sp. CSND-B09]|uniref:helix-turn-helix domain-containing protein n=1 Tax=Brevibacterium sp. CSND-B09 TaxID=3462571 RepID=UPI00406A1F61